MAAFVFSRTTACMALVVDKGGLQQAARWGILLLFLFLTHAFVGVIVLQSIVVLVVVRGQRRGLRQSRRDIVVELGVGGG
jgi:hypothetical protein